MSALFKLKLLVNLVFPFSGTFITSGRKLFLVISSIIFTFTFFGDGNVFKEHAYLSFYSSIIGGMYPILLLLSIIYTIKLDTGTDKGSYSTLYVYIAVMLIFSEIYFNSSLYDKHEYLILLNI